MPMLMFMPFLLIFCLGFCLPNKNKSLILKFFLLFFSELIDTLILFRIFFRFILLFGFSWSSLSALCLHVNFIFLFFFFLNLSFYCSFLLDGFLDSFFLSFLHAVDFVSVDGNLFLFPRDISCAFDSFLLFSDELFFIKLFLNFFINFIICGNTL